LGGAAVKLPRFSVGDSVRIVDDPRDSWVVFSGWLHEGQYRYRIGTYDGRERFRYESELAPPPRN
jgi:hypothetical protein